MQYGFSKSVKYSFEEAIKKVTDELKKEGFGVLTSIDVKDTLKKKIDVDFRRYTILGACNPPFAHKALTTDIEVGLLMPCNVVVYENDRQQTTVAFFDPMVMGYLMEKPAIEPIAKEVREKLKHVFEQI